MTASRLVFPQSQSLPAYARTIDRAVHVRIYPRPANIAESRHILSVLQKYGEVVYYQHLKHDPVMKAANSALALYKEKAEAQELIHASPVRFEMVGAGLKGVSRSRLEAAEDDDDEDLKDAEKKSSPDRPAREFELRIEPSRLNHQAYIQRQHYYGYFEPDSTNLMFSDLEKRVPVVGMADCQVEKAEVPLRLRKRRMERERKEKRGVWRESLGDMWRRGREEAAAAAAEREGTQREGHPGLGPESSEWRRIDLGKGP
ncbi:MAG: hypothetical protein Q9163_001695 [Psora crenata]